MYYCENQLCVAKCRVQELHLGHRLRWRLTLWVRCPLILCWLQWVWYLCLLVSLGLFLSFGSASSFNRKTVAVFSFRRICAFTELICNTKSHTFHSGGGIILVWRNLVSDLLSVILLVGFVAPHKLCPNSFSAKQIAKISSPQADFFIWDEVNVFDPYATGAKLFFAEVYFWLGSSSFRSAYPVAWKMASLINISCLFGSGCQRASWQHVSKVLSRLRCSFMSSGVILLLSLAWVIFNSLKNEVGLSVCLGMYFL